MTRYEPEPPPGTENSELEEYLVKELRRITEALSSIEEIQLVELNVEPDRPRNGMIILVDGTNFNPGGTGAGIYGRIGGAWVKLG